MSKAYPWVERPWPDKELPKDQLLERIEQLLGLKNVCVLATVDKDGAPIASPIEYHADGLNLYMFPDPGTPKLNAMKRDPRVSLAIDLGYHGWQSVRSAQYFAQAEILEPHTPEWIRGTEIFKWRQAAEELGADTSRPREWQIVKVVPDRILYMETWLWKSGYGWKQWWHRDG